MSSRKQPVAGKAYDAQLIRRLWPFVSPHWRLLALALGLMPITALFEIAQPYVLKIAIDEHIAMHTLEGLGILALTYVGLSLLQSFSEFIQQYVLQLLGQKSMHNLRTTLYSHVIHQRMAFFDHTPVGRLLTRMTNDVESINEMFASGVVTVVADLIKLISIVSIMLYLNAKLTLITFLSLPALLLLVHYARNLMRSSFRAIRARLSEMNTYVQEHLSGLRIVQLFRREQNTMYEYNRINAGYRDSYLKAIRADAWMYAGVEAIGTISIACVAWYAGANIVDGVLTVGLIVAFMEYINKFFIPVRDLSAKYTVMQSAMAATERIINLLDTVEQDAPLLAPNTSPRTTSLTSATPAVEFCNVTFSYRPEEPVLRGISLRVQRGHTVAVVGATGSGKSTLMKLLTRLYEKSNGDILLNGAPLETIPSATIRRSITVVSQDVFLFPGTVADNVRLGRPGASNDEIHEALSQVGAIEVLHRRNATAQSLVKERGANFSAGERQLIAFARALIRRSAILIMDEATAHVDPETEAFIEKGLTALMTHRTTLVIAHRLSTIRNANHIAVMSRGRIIESGTHTELLALRGAYAQLESTFSRT